MIIMLPDKDTSFIFIKIVQTQTRPFLKEELSCLGKHRFLFQYCITFDSHHQVGCDGKRTERGNLININGDIIKPVRAI